MSFVHFIDKYRTYLLIFVLLLASILRVYDLENLPSGFHNDEASFFLNAQALKLNLHDEDNNFLPIYLTSFIDPKPALYSYLQIPFIAIFGETHTAARMPAAIFGVISILVTFLLLKKLFNLPIAMIGAFVLTLSPWHIMLSRASQEVIMSFTFALAAIFMLITGVSSKHTRVRPYIFFLFFSLLSMYCYHSAKIFLPLLSLLTLSYFFARKRLSIKQFFLLIAGMTLVTGITVIGGGFARYDAVGIFKSPGVQLVIDEQIRIATGHADSLSIRIFANKLIGYSLAIIKQYGEYFSMNYLFITGGLPSRYVVPFHGLFYLFELFLILCGVAYGLTKENFRKVTYFFLLWLLLVPIPSALTVLEVPSTVRPFPMIIPLVTFIALGIFAICTYKLKLWYRFLPFIILVLYCTSFSYFWFQFSVLQPYYRPWYRHYGSEQLPKAVMTIADNYDAIHIGSNQYIYFALTKDISLDELRKSYPNRLQSQVTFGKITFDNDGCKIFPTKEKILFVIRGECGDFTKKGFKRIGQVNFKDNNPEYVFYEYKSPIKEKILATQQ